MTASPVQCPPADRLKAFAFGRLPDVDCAAVLEHLGECEACASQLETLDDGEDSLVADLRQPDPWGAFGDEPECRTAVIKALGSLAIAGDTSARDTSARNTDQEVLPRQIGEYEILRSLGSGGMGHVYLARHTKLGREVALKVLATHRLADTRLQQRFESEMRAIGRLSHPNIVTAHDAREIEGTSVLITEYIDGLDLGQLMRLVGPLSTADACEIVRVVCVALAYIHDSGFVHRDIKPSNIMLSRSGEVKLLDLGLARYQYGEPDRAELTGTGQAMGTADYIAPEQVTDSRRADARADIYSLGCTLMKLLTGRAPFSDACYPTPFAKMTAHVSKPAPRLKELAKDLPKELAALVDAMLEKEPNKRPQTPASIAQRLLPFTAGAELARLGQIEVAVSPDGQLQSAAVPSTQASRAWQVPGWVAIATGFLGLVFGALLGIIITIKYADGTVAQVHVPAGSQISIAQEESLNPLAAPSVGQGHSLSERSMHSVVPRELEAPMQATPLPPPQRLAFAVLLEQDDLTQNEMGELSEHFKQNFMKGNSENDEVGGWIPLAEELVAPFVREYNGIRYALTAADWERRITWQELAGHVSAKLEATDSSNTQFQLLLSFDSFLEERMRQLTRQHVGKQLAIVVDDQVWLAPIINAEIGSGAAIKGNFSLDALRKVQRQLEWTRLEWRGTQPDGSSSGKIRESLKKIGLAFINFHDAYTKFPGSQNVREGNWGIDGETPYPFSWRVAILPYIERVDLLEQYRFHEPWDSEHNLTLLDKMPEVYRSPYAPEETPKGHTHFLGFATERGALGTGTGHSLSDFTDGTSPTLLIVESSKSVPWTKPEDLTDTHVEPLTGDTLRYLTADGSVHEMSPLDHDKLQKLITRDGGEAIDGP